MNELTKHIEILLLSNDCVIVPGFGGFVAHYCAAMYAEGDDRFCPPKRTLGFNPQLTLNDSLLAQSYVEAYDISYPEAVMRIEAEVEEIMQSIDMYGLYDFQGLGIVSKTTDGRYEFEPCMAGLQTPSLYALSSYSIGEVKHEEEIPQDAPVMVAAVKETEVEDVEEYDEDEEYDEEDGLRISYRRLWYAAAAVLILLLIPMAYNTLSVGRGSQGGNVIKSSVGDTGVEVASKLGKGIDAFVQTTASAQSAADEAKTDVQPAEQKVEEKVEKKDDVQSADAYSIVLASRVSRKGAEHLVSSLSRAGLNEASVYKKGNMIRVLYGKYSTESDAKKALSKLQHKDSRFEGTWVQRMN